MPRLRACGAISPFSIISKGPVRFVTIHCRHFPNTIVTTDTIKHTNIAYSVVILPMVLFCICLWRKKLDWKPLPHFLELVLQGKLVTFLFFSYSFWRDRTGKTDGKAVVLVLCLFLCMDAVNVTSVVRTKTLFVLHLEIEEGVEKFSIRFSGLTRDVPGKVGEMNSLTLVEINQGADCVRGARLFMEHEHGSLTTKSLSSIASPSSKLFQENLASTGSSIYEAANIQRKQRLNRVYRRGGYT